MVSSNKVLTVSYGTFSCTLEGFDESFDTMKAIAEYFRNLAADDRYFGAEPPTPDAEMLARIAEREISRRVKAHEEGGQIVLRAGETEAFRQGEEAPAPETTAPGEKQPEAAAAPAEPETPEPEAESAAPEAPETEPVPSGAGPEPGVAAETATVAAEPETEEPAPAEPGAKTAPETEEPASAEAEPETEEETEEPARVETEARSVSEEGEDSAPSPAEATVATAVEEIEAETQEDEGDSVSARLRRIRSVVAHDASDHGQDDFSEDEHAQDFLTQTAAELTSALEIDEAAEAPHARRPAESGPEPEAAADAAIDPPEDPFANLTARLLEEDAAETPEGREPQQAADAEAAAEEQHPPSEPTAAAAGDTLAQLLADAMPDEPEAEPETDAAPAGQAQAPLEAGGEDRAAETFPPEADTAATPEEDFNLFDGDHPEEEDAVLGPEEEAELQRELAEVEAEIGTGTEAEAATEESDTAEAEAAPEIDTAREDADSAEEKRATRLQASDEDTDISRLFDETDSQLAAPEASKRRNAIQHLRAAVAATKAEKKAGSELREEKSDAPYRSDLAHAVRPRRPRPDEATPRTERPGTRPPAAEERPAPLKLVAEQRVDTPQDPVRPRRVSAARPSAGSSSQAADGTRFADYAAAIGATTLPELLEAAAAYMADVEGFDQFSRPMLMGKLKELDSEGFSREDGLRSFGHLLRQGKLQKLKGGRFTVTDHTEFRARERHAG